MAARGAGAAGHSGGKPLVIDFAEVGMATQGSVHALLADVIRQAGSKALDLLEFRNCAPGVKVVVEMVCDYAQSGQSVVTSGAMTAERFEEWALELHARGEGVDWGEFCNRLRRETYGFPSGPAGDLLAWLAANMVTHPAGEATLVVTPFLDHRNDGIEYRILRRARRGWPPFAARLHDNGTALNNLEMSGVELESAMPHVRRILNRTGVQLVGRRLELNTARPGLGLSQLLFVQCLQSVDSLTVLARL